MGRFALKFESLGKLGEGIRGKGDGFKAMNSIRTDLALEAREAVGEIPGVEMEQENLGATVITRVRVATSAGARRMGKPIGRYITIENEALSRPETLRNRELGGIIAQELRALLGPGEGENAMVVGLGNRSLTPDSLGPRVTGEILVSRHIREHMPDYLDERVRSVCAISPGVMGVTGIETGELVRSAVRLVQPSCLIVVDSLAARSRRRILGTVQISDAGVVPGSGVGNHRTALNRQSLGLPVIAVGVPMVVRAAVIGRETLETALENIVQREGVSSVVGRRLTAYLREEGLDDLVCEDGPMHSFVVTPVSIDEAVRNVASLVAEGINRCLQPELCFEEIQAMLP